MAKATPRHPVCQFESDKSWLNLQYHSDGMIKKPEELQKDMQDPPRDINGNILDRIYGSMIGLALGDALGAFVEFRPHAYLLEYPVKTLKGGGTWGLNKGQFTDDTSMAICLANSLITRQDYVPYDQLVRFKWWYRNGYMSSTGKCFDIGAATRHSLAKFESRQKEFAEKHNIPFKELDYLSDPKLLADFDVKCSEDGVAGNGPLMRLAPVALFFYRKPVDAVRYSGDSGKTTHGDKKASDACRYYGALIVAALNGALKSELLSKNFYKDHKEWFGEDPLHDDIMKIAEGSYQKDGGYNAGIRGKGYIVESLKAALWAFWSDKDSFRDGVLAAINLGDDTDTTAAIYGQLAGAYYGYANLPNKWTEQIYAKDFIQCLSKWIFYEGKRWHKNKSTGSNMTVNASCAKTNSKTGSRRFSTYDKVFALKSNLDEHYVSDRVNSADNLEPTSATERIYIHSTLKTVADVYDWLSSRDNDCKNYADIFKEHDVDAYWFLNQMDNENLLNIGIDNEDDRKTISSMIEQLKQECPKKHAKEGK